MKDWIWVYGSEAGGSFLSYAFARASRGRWRTLRRPRAYDCDLLRGQEGALRQEYRDREGFHTRIPCVKKKGVRREGQSKKTSITFELVRKNDVVGVERTTWGGTVSTEQHSARQLVKGVPTLG